MFSPSMPQSPSGCTCNTPCVLGAHLPQLKRQMIIDRKEVLRKKSAEQQGAMVTLARKLL